MFHNSEYDLPMKLLTLNCASALSCQRRRSDYCRRLCYQRSLYWPGCCLWYRHPPHIRKVRSITSPKNKHSIQAHNGTDTPGYRKCLPYSSSSAPPGTTLTPHCNLSVRRAQSQPTAAPFSHFNSLSPLASLLSVLTFTSIIVRYF